jgi:hypothetical protein
MEPRRPSIDSVLATIIIALIGFFGTTVASIVNNSNSNKLEQRKFEYELIKRGFEISDDVERIKFLKSLTTLKLVHDNEMAIALDSLVDHPEDLPQLTQSIPLAEPLVDTNSAVELTLKRTTMTDSSTIGQLSVNGKVFAYSLEDRDRGLKADDPMEHINKIKVPGETAIPTGRYEVILAFSNQFQVYLPLVLNVPGFEGIRIQGGHSSKELDGDIVIGSVTDGKMIWESDKAVMTLAAFFKKNEVRTKVFLTIQ